MGRARIVPDWQWWVAEQDGTHMVYCAVSIVFGPSQRCLRLLAAPDAFSPRLCLPDLPARVVLGGESLDKPRLCRERVLPTATPTQRLQRSAGPSPVDSNPVLICRTRWARSRRAGVAGAHQREKRRHALFGHGSVTRNVYGMGQGSPLLSAILGFGCGNSDRTFP